MKDTYVIISETSFDNGAYEITINTHLGSFTGYTKPDEIDSKYLSKYHASEIALTKALRKFGEAIVSVTKREIKLLESLMKQSIDSAVEDCDVDNTSFRLINGTLRQKQKELKDWQERVDGLTKSIKIRVSERDKLVARYVAKDKTE
jgi:hypothetical protein